MILRVIRGRAGRGQIEALRETLRVNLGREAAGERPERIHLGVRPVALDDVFDILILVFWRSAEAVAAADARRASVLFLGRDAGLELEPAHFEIDETIDRQSDQEPAALRVATGRFSKPGADIEMQNLLRRRLPEIEDDMTEAYVGRRMDGSSIDVTFISAWQRIPPDRRLEDPIWPDIALRYDEFTVDVFSPLPPVVA